MNSTLKVRQLFRLREGFPFRRRESQFKGSSPAQQRLGFLYLSRSQTIDRRME